MSDIDDRRLEIATRLREAREYLGLSQDDVAAALNLSRPAVTNLESGIRKLDSLELEKLARLYGRPVAYFLDGEQPKVEAANVAFAARAFAGLSDKDLAEVARFADFLRATGKRKTGRR